MKWKDTGGGDFEQPPIGNHVARCIRIIDIGSQKSEYKGKATCRRQCVIAWELPDDIIEQEGEYQGKPHIVSRFYTQSLSEKANLRHDLENWRGRPFTKEELDGFDSKNIISKPCLVTVALSETGKAKVTNVSALPRVKGPDGKPQPITVSKQFHPSIFLSLDPDEFDQEVFNNLTEGYKKMIMASPEYQAILNGPTTSTFDEYRTPNEDIPF